VWHVSPYGQHEGETCDRHNRHFSSEGSPSGEEVRALGVPADHKGSRLLGSLILLFSDIFTSFFLYLGSSFFYEFTWYDMHHVPHGSGSWKNFGYIDVIPKQSTDSISFVFDESKIYHHSCFCFSDVDWSIYLPSFSLILEFCIHDILELFGRFFFFMSDEIFHASVFFFYSKKILFSFDLSVCFVIHDMKVIDECACGRKDVYYFYSGFSEEIWNRITIFTKESFGFHHSSFFCSE